MVDWTGVFMNSKNIFWDLYGRMPERSAFCPYRVCPLGAHIDHQKGKINGLAIDKGISILYSPNRSDIFQLTSLNYPESVSFRTDSVPPAKAGDWADYLRGAVRQFSYRYRVTHGISAVIDGMLPVGGLSSSASVIIVFLMALAEANCIRLEQQEIIGMAKRAENEYVGVNCGILDQSCEVLCRKDRLFIS